MFGNMLTGSLSQDKIFVSGDKAQVVVHWQEAEPDERFVFWLLIP